MSELSKKARADMKSKAKRMAGGDPHKKVDASSWEPTENMNTEAKTGLRPVSPRAYKRGGMVAEGAKEARADRKPRAGGGQVTDFLGDAKKTNAALGKPHIGGYKKGGRAGKMYGGVQTGNTGTIYGDANKKAKGGAADHGKSCRCKACMGGRMERKHGGRADANWLGAALNGKMVGNHAEKTEGGTSKQGERRSRLVAELRAHRADGGRTEGLKPVGPLLKKIVEQAKPKDEPAKRAAGGKINDGSNGARPTGGRLAKKRGGKTGNVNIIIQTGKDQTPPPMGLGGPPKPMIPPAMPMPAPPPGGMGAPVMGPGGPPMGAPPMMRKRGGRAGYAAGGETTETRDVLKGKKYRSYKDMDAGALGGKGRLEKVEIQKNKG